MCVARAAEYGREMSGRAGMKGGADAAGMCVANAESAATRAADAPFGAGVSPGSGGTCGGKSHACGASPRPASERMIGSYVFQDGHIKVL